jgi:hypothetical protein
MDLRRTEALIFNAFFVSRRLILVVLITFFSWFPALQVQLILFTAIAAMVYSYSS